MKYTQNYNLKKPEGTDVVNIDDLNYNADVIDTELAKCIVNITNLSNTVVLKGTSNQDVNLVQALIQSVDTRNTSLTYDGNNRLTTITEKDGTTTVKTTTLSYDANGRLSTVTEVVGGKTIITTLSYDSYSNIVGVSKEVI